MRAIVLSPRTGQRPEQPPPEIAQSDHRVTTSVDEQRFGPARGVTDQLKKFLAGGLPPARLG